jgi:hypothetical protein
MMVMNHSYEPASEDGPFEGKSMPQTVSFFRKKGSGLEVKGNLNEYHGMKPWTQ